MTGAPGGRSALPAQDRQIAALVFAGLLACYLLTYTGIIRSSDGLAMFSTAESLVRRGDIDSNQLLWMGLQQNTFGPTGDLYSRKGLGMTLLALPLVWIARMWPAMGLTQAALLLNPLLTAATGSLVYLTARRLGWRRAAAILTALTFGLLTLAWPYTQDFFSDPVTGFGSFLAIYGIVAFQQTGRRTFLWAAGAGWGVAYLSRTLHLITLPVFALALAAVIAPALDLAEGRAARGRLRAWIGSALRAQWEARRAWVAFGLPVAVAGLLSLAWNWVRFGSLLQSGYLPEESFTGNWPFGIWGLLAGPARGLIWYSPILLLGILGAPWFWRQRRWLLGLIVGFSAVYVLAYGKWFMWHGGYAWGPRFLVPILPCLALLMGPVWERALSERWTVGRVLLAALGVASLTVNALGLLAPYNLVQDELAGTIHPLFAAETFTRWQLSPLVMQWRYLRAENIQFAWWIAGPDWPGALLPLAALGVAGWLLARVARDERRLTRGDAALAGLLAVLVVASAALATTRYQRALSGAGNREIATRISALEQPGDAIAHFKPEETQQFANAYHGRLPTLGFMPGPELSEADRGWLDRIRRAYDRVWTVSADPSADASPWERALRGGAYTLLEENEGDAEGRTRLALYALTDLETAASAAPAAFVPAAGEPALLTLTAYAFDERSQPGGDLRVKLIWRAERPTGQNYKVFVHLLDATGQAVAQRDGEPVAWQRPTSTWQPGEEIVDRYGLALPSELPSGSYTLMIGLYEPATGARLILNSGQDAFTLGAVELR